MEDIYHWPPQIADPNAYNYNLKDNIILPSVPVINTPTFSLKGPYHSWEVCPKFIAYFNQEVNRYCENIERVTPIEDFIDLIEWLIEEHLGLFGGRFGHKELVLMYPSVFIDQVYYTGRTSGVGFGAGFGNLCGYMNARKVSMVPSTSPEPEFHLFWKETVFLHINRVCRPTEIAVIFLNVSKFVLDGPALEVSQDFLLKSKVWPKVEVDKETELLL
jgi:hypothetical protein